MRAEVAICVTVRLFIDLELDFEEEYLGEGELEGGWGGSPAEVVLGASCGCLHVRYSK